MRTDEKQAMNEANRKPDELSTHLFDIPESWKMTETEKVVAIIREVGCWRLGNFDGCICCRFSIRNVDVHISCGKGGERAVRVDSPSLDYWDGTSEDGCDEALLRPIMDEVIRQVETADRRGAMARHFGNAKRSTPTP